MADIQGRIIDSSTRAWIADVVVTTTGASYAYVDGSLALRDASIEVLFIENDAQDVSIAWLNSEKMGAAYNNVGDGEEIIFQLGTTPLGWTPDLYTIKGGTDIEVSTNITEGLIINYTGGSADVTFAYVDGSLATRDASITALFVENDNQDSSINDIWLEIATLDSSITYLYNWNDILDASVGALVLEDIRQDGSITTLFNEDIRLDGSINALFIENDNQDVSIAWLDTNKLEQVTDTAYTGGIGWYRSTANNIAYLKKFEPSTNIHYQDYGDWVSIWVDDPGTSAAYVDGSLAARDISIAWLYTNKLHSDASLSDLSDVDTASVGAAQDGSALVWDNGTSTWIAGVAGGGGGLTDVSMGGITDTSIGTVIDGDLLQYTGDTSTWDNITPVDISTLVIDASDYFYTKTQTDASFALISSIPTDFYSQAYVDGSLNVKVNRTLFDSSIGALTLEDLRQDGSITTLFIENDAQDISIAYLDSSVTWLYENQGVGTFEELSDVSINGRSDGDSIIYNNDTSTWDNIATVDISALYYEKTYIDGSLNLKVNRTLFDSSIAALVLEDIRLDGSITSLFGTQTIQDASITYLDSSVTWLYENTTGSLADLSDTSVYSAIVGDLIQITDGSIWENITPVDISTLTLDASEYFLQILDASTTYLKQTDASTIYRKKGNDSYGQLYIHDASLVKSIPTGTTYIPLGPWTVSDISSNMTYDPSRYFMKPQVTGKYRVNAHISFATDTNSVTTRGVVFQGGVEKNWLHFADFRGVGANIIQSSSITGIIDVSVADTSIGFRIKHDDGGTVVYTIYYANFNISRIAD